MVVGEWSLCLPYYPQTQNLTEDDVAYLRVLNGAQMQVSP
jgi:hypothetical protein